MFERVESPLRALACLALAAMACAGPAAEQRTASALVAAACAATQAEVIARTHVEADWNAARDEIRAACETLAKYVP